MPMRMRRIFVLTAILGSMDVNALLFTCKDIPLKGKKSVAIDTFYIVKTRMLEEIPEHQEIVISEFITSGTKVITFQPLEGSPGFFSVTMNNNPQELSYLLGWVSNRERDGVCAIELQGYRNGSITREFLQILAIYPDSTLAVGLPNTTDRQGLILIKSDLDI